MILSHSFSAIVVDALAEACDRSAATYLEAATVVDYSLAIRLCTRALELRSFARNLRAKARKPKNAAAPEVVAEALENCAVSEATSLEMYNLAIEQLPQDSELMKLLEIQHRTLKFRQADVTNELNRQQASMSAKPQAHTMPPKVEVNVELDEDALS